MSTWKTLLVINTVLTLAGVLLGHHCLFFALEAFVKLAAAALLLAGTV
jgi:hypothetical protein